MNEGVRDFGSALREAVRDERSQDYASLVELEYVETSEEFAEVIKKFMRRYDTYARKYGIRRPKEESLEELVKLVDRYGVRPIRAILISLALLESPKEDEKLVEEEVNKNE